MGKRKSSAKPPPKKKQEKLQVLFACPFCNHAKSVTCNLDMDKELGFIKCSQSAAAHTARITHLSEAIE